MVPYDTAFLGHGVHATVGIACLLPGVAAEYVGGTTVVSYLLNLISTKFANVVQCFLERIASTGEINHMYRWYSCKFMYN